MLPGESEVSAQIRKTLTHELQLGNSLLVACVSILTERHPTHAAGKDEVMPYNVGRALCFKACKTYRSILLLSQIGASHDVDILDRTIFETTLALVFVLQERVTFGIAGFPDADLTSDLRARIYAACHSIQRHADFTRHKDDQRFTDIVARVPKVNSDKLQDQAAEAETDVGPFWANRIKTRPFTYSGFTLKALAAKLDPDLSRWYGAIYGEQSKPVHAVDAAKHVRFDANENRMVAKWQSSIPEVRTALIPASVLMCRCIHELHQRFHFSDNQREGLSTSQEIEIAWALLQRAVGTAWNAV